MSTDMPPVTWAPFMLYARGGLDFLLFCLVGPLRWVLAL